MKNLRGKQIDFTYLNYPWKVLLNTVLNKVRLSTSATMVARRANIGKGGLVAFRAKTNSPNYSIY